MRFSILQFRLLNKLVIASPGFEPTSLPEFRKPTDRHVGTHPNRGVEVSSLKFFTEDEEGGGGKRDARRSWTVSNVKQNKTPVLQDTVVDSGGFKLSSQSKKS